MENKRKKIKFPHVYIMFIIVMLLVLVLSWIVPSGEFERVPVPNNPSVMEVNPDVFNYVEDAKPITPMDFFGAMHQGLINAGDIIVMLLLVCGTLYLLEDSGAIGAGIGALLKVSSGKEVLIIASLCIIFSILGAIGFAEGGIPFVPLCMTVVMGMGYDRITGFAAATFGLAVGFASGVINVYTTGVAQEIVGLPLFSGIGFRIIGLIIFTLFTVVYLLHYAKKIKADPSKSIMGEEYIQQLKDMEKEEIDAIEFDTRKKIAIISMIFVFGLQAYGATQWGWTLKDMSALYIMYAIFLTILLKLSPNDAATKFGMGAARILPSALAIGFASGVMVLMNQAKIIDTAIHSLAGTLSGKPVFLTFFLLFITVVIFNFFVTSGSGKAVILMPIMGPLGKILNINQQIMVVLYQYGDGFTNYLWPTAGALMASLGMCDLEYGKWVKFAAKPFIILHIIAFILILIANQIGLGPF